MAQENSECRAGGAVPVIELRHVDKHFGALHVLKDVSLSVHKGEVVVIIGPSGSGKSTLCRTMNRLETIDAGEIIIDGVPMPQEGKKLAGLRSQIGTMYGTLEKGPRYLEMAEGYILDQALDKNGEIIGYRYVSLGKMMEAIRKGMDPKEAFEKNTATYGRYAEADKIIDPRRQ